MTGRVIAYMAEPSTGLSPSRFGAPVRSLAVLPSLVDTTAPPPVPSPRHPFALLVVPGLDPRLLADSLRALAAEIEDGDAMPSPDEESVRAWSVRYGGVDPNV